MKGMVIFMNKAPLISVIIPVYNGEKRLPLCLDSIKKQTYPQDKIEIIIVDDDSTDNTVKLAKEKYGCKVYRNGTHNPERGKSIGIEYANGEYLFFIDDDNELVHKTTLATLVKAVIKENANGGQIAKFHYDESLSMADKYAALYGTADPAVYYLDKCDHLKWTDKRWTLSGTVEKSEKKYYLMKFTEKNLPTIGSQGFLIKKELVKMVHWQPFFYHIDSNVELIRLGFDKYVILKDSIIHRHSSSVGEMVSKMRRNAGKWGNKDEDREFSYNLTMPKMIKLGLCLGTFVIPLCESIQGYKKYKSTAWFIHPFFCFYTACIYTWSTLKSKSAWKSLK